MKIGTRSVLFGAHQFLIHPWFVAWGWWKLYRLQRVYIGYASGYPQTYRWRLGFRGGPKYASLLDPRLWLVFFVHDLGYIGKPNIEGDEGECHPLLGARIMAILGDGHSPRRIWTMDSYHGDWLKGPLQFGPWGELTLLHSRFLARHLEKPVSALCYADKMAIALTPAWLYLPMVRATGEINEYMRLADSRNLVIDGRRGGKYSTMQTRTQEGERAWYADVQDYVRRWVEEHKDGRPDAWTPRAGASER